MNPDLLSTEKKSSEDWYLDSPMHISHSSDIQSSTFHDVDSKIYTGQYIEYRLADGKLIPIVREYKVPAELGIDQ